MITVLKPTHDLIFVEEALGAQTHESGLLVVGGDWENCRQGTVVSTGPGKTYTDGQQHALSVKPGDRVIFSEFAGQSFKDGDRMLIALREDDIYAVVEGS